jgi:hypothetical protein
MRGCLIGGSVPNFGSASGGTSTKIMIRRCALDFGSASNMKILQGRSPIAICSIVHSSTIALDAI